MKKLLALTICLMLMLGLTSALASGSIATYELPAGADVRYISEAADFAVPDGLAPMYDLMQNASPYGDIYLVRMKNGRALVSVGCTLTTQPRTAEELHARWNQIAQKIALEADDVNMDPSCAAVEHLYGFDMLHVRTDITAGGVPLKAEAFAFCRGEEMLEVWAVHPAASVYQNDLGASSELESDMADLAQFLHSLDFSGDPPPTFEGEYYTAPDGRFRIGIPQGGTVITSHSSPEEVEQARSLFIAANAAGADNAFDQLMQDVTEEDCLLMITADQKGLIQVYCNQNDSFAGVTTEQLLYLTEPVCESLQERFGNALVLAAQKDVLLAGQSHSMIGYWVRSGECNLQLDVAACILGDNWLCETDILTVDGDEALRKELHTLIGLTLQYNVD